MILAETKIPAMYQQSVRANGFLWEPGDTPKMYEAITIAISEFLGEVKEKETKVALAIKDLKGNLRMAGIVQYHKNEENPDMPGNWSYVLTFDEEDLKDCRIYESNDVSFQRFFNNAAYFKCNFTIDAYDLIQTAVVTAINCLLDYLDKNADPTEEKTIELEGYFVVSVVVDKSGKKIFSIVPDGSMKRLIKDDAAIQK
jgi:hypothetical protein